MPKIMYRLLALGGAALLRDGDLLDRVGGQRKLIALLALLAVAGRRGLSRDRIAAQLWPESDGERARGALKQSLHLLRRQFGTAEVVIGTSELRLNPEVVSSDAADLLDAVEAGDHQRVIAVYAGPFLDGFHLSGNAEFEQWAGEQRSVLMRHHANSLEVLARRAQQQGAFPEAASLWRRLQSVEPFSTAAATGLMEALEAAGERGAALRAGQAFETLLREELGSAIDPAVASLLQRLRASAPLQGADPDLAPAGPPGPPDPVSPPASQPRADAGPEVRRHPVPRHPGGRWAASVIGVFALTAAVALWLQGRGGGGPAEQSASAAIAVIPFVNTSDHAADGHFADGLTDELISRLGRVAGMRVSARTSTFALRDLGLSARAFADTLGAAWVIEGTVRRQDDRLKITAQLVDPKDNSVLWAEAYDRQVRDLIAVQEEIALAITHALQRRFPTRPAGPMPEAALPSVDTAAYELYLRGRYERALPAPERFHHAARYHQAAVERDPSFAAAYAALAETYVNLAIYGYLPPAEALARANAAADRALDLDSRLVEALAARAYVRLFRLEFPGAETDLRAALAVNPSYAWAHHFLSLYLLMVGRPREAELHNDQALRLDPLSLPALATRGTLLARSGDYPAAERHLAKALAQRPDFVLTLYYLGVVQAALGRHEAAIQSLRDAFRQAPEYPGLPGALAFALDRRGRNAEAESILAELEGRAPADPRARLNLALAYGVFGRHDAAFALLEGVRLDVPSLIGLRADPLLEGMRADPRWRRLLRTVGAQD